MGQHKTRNIVLGLLAGGAAIWGIQELLSDDHASASTTRPHGHAGGGMYFFGRPFGGWWGGGGGGGSTHGDAGSSVGRGGFGSTGSHGAS